MRTKPCTQCKKNKPVDQFYKQSLTRHSMCNECRREYNKKRYAKQKKTLKQSKW